MKKRNSFVWKLNAMVLCVVLAALVVSAAIEWSLPAGWSLGPKWPVDLLLVVVLAGTMCVVALRFLLRHQLMRPVDQLIRGTRQVGSGDLEFRFNTTRPDELGELGRSFDRMTQKVQAHQAELVNALEYLQGILESSADIIITVSPNNFIERFNKGAENALGYRRTEVQGKRIEMLFARKEDREIALEQLADSDNVVNFATDFVTKDGEIRNVLLTLSRLRSPDGEPIGTFGISKDITEERKLIKQVIEMKKLAAIGEAVTGIQHAVKNMLNALKGGAYVLKSGIRTKKRKRVVEGWAMVEEGIERMSNLSLSLLNYARDWKLTREEVNVAELIEKVRDVVKVSAAGKGIELLAEPGEMDSIISCDPRLIHMVLMDLVSNSIDACVWKDYSVGERPEVVLTTNIDAETDLFEIQVRDNGCGMTDEVKENLFKPFFSTKDNFGTGVGLSVTDRVIERHHGRIRVESELGVGTTISVGLPRNIQDTSAKESAHEDSPDHR